MSGAGAAYEGPVDENGKCKEFSPFILAFGFIPVPHCGRRRRTNPQMRGFWAGTVAFHVAFLGWFALPPLMVVVRKDIGLCDNDAVLRQNPLAECECGSSCIQWIANANIASVALDLGARLMLGNVLEKRGPKTTIVLLMVSGGLLVGASSAVTTGVGLIIVRFVVSVVGSMFVANQFWNSMLFNRSVIGVANATSSGWGNTGGGVAQIAMPLLYLLFRDVAELELAWAWRAAVLVVAALFLVIAAWILLFTQATVTGDFDVSSLGKTTHAGFETFVKCAKDYRIVFLFFQYGACLGCELVMHNVLAMHFYDYFGLNLLQSGALAMCFGLTAIFARSMGSMLANWAGQRWSMRGRLWVHFLSLLGEGIALVLFGSVQKDMVAGVAGAVLVVFGICLNMAKGTCYSIVPFLLPEHLGVASGVVGAGGVLGAILCSLLYKLETELLAFKLHGLYVVLWALTVPTMSWAQLGSMWRSQKQTTSKFQPLPQPLSRQLSPGSLARQTSPRPEAIGAAADGAAPAEAEPNGAQPKVSL